jgi:hypothetical protein
MPLMPSRQLILYLTRTKKAMRCVLGQHDKSSREERAIYYLNNKFIYYEVVYIMVEKLCCALVWAAKRLR